MTTANNSIQTSVASGQRQSQLFTKTRKHAPSDEVSRNAELLIRAGYIHKEMAGVYAMLPLGLRVINNIENIIRKELNSYGAQELIMTALQKKETWVPTGRWDDAVVDDWFKTKLKNDSELGLAFTHEEPITILMKNFISSYKDLPIYVYQFQSKFRNELRAKSGVMRGREFVMKDLYEFSLDEEQHKEFYEKMKTAYMNIFTAVGLGDQTYLTMSSGGSFSKYSFEFQTISEAGEDVILYDEKERIAINKADYSEDIFKDFNLDKSKLSFKEARSIEVGDIYTLGEKYAKALGLTYKNKEGEEKVVFMGSYGIGVPRLMGTVVEVFNDEKGIVWPKNIAPFKVHIVRLGESEEVVSQADSLYENLLQKGVDVLYDDRNVRAGEKFADSDLIGIPLRIVVSENTLANAQFEVVERATGEKRMQIEEELVEELTQ
jgi:prolyl-tRNA synthetase